MQILTASIYWETTNSMHEFNFIDMVINNCYTQVII